MLSFLLIISGHGFKDKKTISLPTVRIYQLSYMQGAHYQTCSSLNIPIVINRSI